MKISVLPVAGFALFMVAACSSCKPEQPAVQPIQKQAAAAKPVSAEPISGVWAGTIDDRKARLCIDESATQNYQGGRIYYLGDAGIRGLHRQNNESAFREQDDFSDDEVKIRIAPGSEGRLTVWREFAGKTSKSTLTAVAVAAGGSGSCASDEFLAPRLDGLPKKVAQLTLDGLHYSRYSYDPGAGFAKVAMIGIALDGSQSGDKAINATLHAAVTGWGTGDDYLSCSQHYRTDPNFFVFKHEARPRYLSKRLASVSIEYDGGCGGIHDSGIYYIVFDRVTGKSVGPEDWFESGALKFEGKAFRAQFSPNPQLLGVISSLISSDPENEGIRTDLENCDMPGFGDPPCAFALFLDHNGLGFLSYQQGVPMIPRGTVIVPWARIKPFLKPQAWALLRPGG